MSKVSTSISIDADVKAKAQELFADLGMDLSTAINIFLRQSIRESGIPFVIHREEPNAVTMAAMDAATRPISRLVRAPQSSWLRMSWPSLSVPSRWPGLPGGTLRSSVRI